jgi:hypothetical protein
VRQSDWAVVRNVVKIIKPFLPLFLSRWLSDLCRKTGIQTFIWNVLISKCWFHDLKHSICKIHYIQWLYFEFSYSICTSVVCSINICLKSKCMNDLRIIYLTYIEPLVIFKAKLFLNWGIVNTTNFYNFLFRHWVFQVFKGNILLYSKALFYPELSKWKAIIFLLCILLICCDLFTKIVSYSRRENAFEDLIQLKIILYILFSFFQ